MTLLGLVQGVLLVGGAGFFVIGTLGLMRFPDALTRLHALTKVDNLGLGLVILALLPSAPSVAVALKMVLVWMLTLGASATAGHLIAQVTYYREHRGTEVDAAQDMNPDPDPDQETRPQPRQHPGSPGARDA